MLNFVINKIMQPTSIQVRMGASRKARNAVDVQNEEKPRDNSVSFDLGFES